MISLYSAEAARQSADSVRKHIGDDAPQVGIILGSGLGGLADQIEDAVRVPFADVPGFPEVTVVGHAGALVSGTLGGRRVIALAGRFHMYEGHP
ncbi:MAG: purine-nucleoside phosphorylase, partial [Gemmatimonadales bacterium]